MCVPQVLKPPQLLALQQALEKAFDVLAVRAHHNGLHADCDDRML